MHSLLYGFITSLALIVSIGPQGAFILKQGLLKNHIFVICFICAFCDVVLMILGVFGLGSIIAKNRAVLVTVGILGVIFLLYYAFLNFKSAFKNREFALEKSENLPLKKAVLITLAVTLLNPAVYLDTIVILGSIGSSLEFDEKVLFTIGGLIASCGWFFLLGYGARALIPLFKNRLAWQSFDIAVGILMIAIAASIVNFVINEI